MKENEMTDCRGYETSDCCGWDMDTDTGLCLNCNEHCDSQCVNCENKTECPHEPDSA